jgi:hypothetical protein
MNAEAFPASDLAGALEWESSCPDPVDSVRPGGWNLEDFTREQIRGLVRQVFFSSADRPIRQVVFSAVDPETEALSICRQVGEALALETQGSVAVVGGFPQILKVQEVQPDEVGKKDPCDGGGRLRQNATKVRANLWWIPTEEGNSDLRPATSLHARLGQVRREFDYSIIGAPSASESHAAMAMAQFADGIVLVLSARYTRRAVARKIKESLEGTKARILGTVLSERVFPIPEALYRRL